MLRWPHMLTMYLEVRSERATTLALTTVCANMKHIELMWEQVATSIRQLERELQEA